MSDNIRMVLKFEQKENFTATMSSLSSSQWLQIWLPMVEKFSQRRFDRRGSFRCGAAFPRRNCGSSISFAYIASLSDWRFNSEKRSYGPRTGYARALQGQGRPSLVFFPGFRVFSGERPFFFATLCDTVLKLTISDNM